jgi:MFS transporter, DHA1 family, multidrug resistance protein
MNHPNQASVTSSAVNPIPFLALMLALMMSVGPFAIDTYLPAFSAMSLDLRATPLQLQATLTAYLVAFSIMNLVHGAISDAVGRKKVIITGSLFFAFASVGASTATSIEQLWVWRALQGLASGAGASVGRAVARDVTSGSATQRLMGQATMAFALAPAIAPVIGGLLLLFTSWRSIFIGLAAMGLGTALLVWRLLPETLPIANRQPLSVSNLKAGYTEIFSQGVFWRLTLAMCLGMAGFMIYILSAPNYVTRLLGLSEQSFYILFFPLTLGTLCGGFLSSRIAGKRSVAASTYLGFTIMVIAAVLHLIAIALVEKKILPAVPWAACILFFYTLGAGTMLSSIQVLVLESAPDRKGMVSACTAFTQSLISATFAVVLLPFIWDSLLNMAVTGLALPAVAFTLFHWQQRVAKRRANLKGQALL